MLITIRLNHQHSARSLGVVFDSHLNLESNINNVYKSAYFHLRIVDSVRNMLTDNNNNNNMYLKSSIQTSSIDYNIHITITISSNIPIQYTKNTITNT